MWTNRIGFGTEAHCQNQLSNCTGPEDLKETGWWKCELTVMFLHRGKLWFVVWVLPREVNCRVERGGVFRFPRFAGAKGLLLSSGHWKLPGFCLGHWPTASGRVKGTQVSLVSRTVNPMQNLARCWHTENQLDLTNWFTVAVRADYLHWFHVQLRKGQQTN